MVMKRIGSFAALFFMLLDGRAQEGPTHHGEPAKLKDYVVYLRFPLTAELNGVGGELQLLQDARLPATPRNQIWGQLAADRDNSASLFTVSVRATPP
jgi:hypothetical protein